MKNKEDKLKEVVEQVRCPFNALQIQNGSECVCTYGFRMHKSKVRGVSLGDIEKDILNHCKACPFKSQKQEEKQETDKATFITLKKSDEDQVKCPAEDNQSVFIEDKCKSCMFLNKGELRKDLEKGKELVNIYCNFPNVSPDLYKCFLPKNTKTALKRRRTMELNGKEAEEDSV